MSLEVRGLCLSLSAARPASDADLESQQRALLENISFRLAPGEIAVIRGPSGTGKSTLLKALAALIPFDSGSVTLDGKTAEGLGIPAWRARVLYVPQRAPALPGNPRELLNTTLSYSSQSSKSKLDASRTLREAADRLGLDAQLDQPWSSLSGGEAQRALLAVALALDPDVLLLDEPTASLDAESAGRAEELLKGRTCVIVTHSDEQEARLGAEIKITLGAR